MKPNDLNSLSTDEISREIDKKEQELKTAIVAHEVLEQERLNIQRQILELQLKKKDREIPLSKSSSNIKQINIELRLLRSRYWTVKNEGR